ncbi:hypothetical protein TDB9533_00913 [Thalassocella blandensis]|nr:hypothetical protein TDB9533_00913 [Thalassocella blandensis]
MERLHSFNALLIENDDQLQGGLVDVFNEFKFNVFDCASSALSKGVNESLEYDLLVCHFDSTSPASVDKTIRELKDRGKISYRSVIVVFYSGLIPEQNFLRENICVDEYIDLENSMEESIKKVEFYCRRFYAFTRFYNYIASEKYEDAINELKFYIRQRDEYADHAKRMLARLYIKLNMESEAEELYKKEMDCNGSGWALIGLLDLLLRQKRYSTVLDLLEDFLNTYPCYLRAYHYLVRTVHQACGNEAHVKESKKGNILGFIDQFKVGQEESPRRKGSLR